MVFSNEKPLSTGIRCVVYKSARVPNVYVLTQIHQDPSRIIQIVHYGPFERISEIELTSSTVLIGASVDQIIQNIALHGFHLQGMEIRQHVSPVGSAVAGGLLGVAVGGPIGAIVGAAIGAVLADQNNKKGPHHD